MFIRVTPGTYDPARQADVQQWSEERLLPALKQMAGFRGYYGGFNAQAGRLVSISTWDEQAQAEALRANLGPLLDEIPSLGVTLETSQTFEVGLTG